MILYSPTNYREITKKQFSMFMTRDNFRVF